MIHIVIASEQQNSVVDAVVQGAPTLSAVEEVVVPRGGRTLFFSRPNPKPISSLQKRCDIAIPDALFEKPAQLFRFRHAPPASLEVRAVQAVYPVVGLMPIRGSIRPCIPFQTAVFIVHNPVRVFDKVAVPQALAFGREGSGEVFFLLRIRRFPPPILTTAFLLFRYSTNTRVVPLSPVFSSTHFTVLSPASASMDVGVFQSAQVLPSM